MLSIWFVWFIGKVKAADKNDKNTGEVIPSKPPHEIIPWAWGRVEGTMKGPLIR
jgi:hypothetical protein